MLRRLTISAITIVSIAGSTAHAQRVHNAAADGNLERLRSVLSCDKDLVHATDRRGATPLHLAALEGHPDAVRVLLDEGSSPNATEAHGFTPLHFAALRGHADVASLLLTAGADPNLPAADGRGTPTELAILSDAFRGTTKLTEQMVAHGGTIDPFAPLAVPVSRTLLAYLVGNDAMVQLLHRLLERGDGEGSSATAAAPN